MGGVSNQKQLLIGLTSASKNKKTSTGWTRSFFQTFGKWPASFFFPWLKPDISGNGTVTHRLFCESHLCTQWPAFICRTHRERCSSEVWRRWSERGHSLIGHNLTLIRDSALSVGTQHLDVLLMGFNCWRDGWSSCNAVGWKSIMLREKYSIV